MLPGLPDDVCDSISFEKWLQQVEVFWQQYLQLLEDGHDYDDNVDTYRWLIEEFRVALFAQQLGTRTKVSAQRLQKAWQEID